MDGVIYQEVPMPSDSTYEIGMLANANAYACDSIGGSGHLKVTVSPACVKVDFVRAYLPADTISGIHKNREVAFSYSIGNCSSAISETDENMIVNVYPNPASDNLTVALSQDIKHLEIRLLNSIGQTILQTQSNNIVLSHFPNGVYFLNVRTEKYELNKKVVIAR